MPATDPAAVPTNGAAAASSGGRPVRFRLHRAPPAAAPQLTAEQRAVVGHAGGRLRVLAGPGTGKTQMLVEAVAERVRDRGVPAEQILVLTFSRRAAAELAGRITRRVAVTTREPLVRTLHSYALFLLRSHAIRAGEPVPRLLAAGESDQMVRELLAGNLESGAHGWPRSVTRALGSVAFAVELRDLLLRAAERGIDPRRLADWGRRRRRPEWLAAARFAREYQQVADLRQGSSGFGAALDQAELTTAALGVLANDAELAAEQAHRRRIFVDEYQDVDPAQARLVELVGSAADELVVVGDPDQAIYGFRGADPRALQDFAADRTVTLTGTFRLPPELVEATRGLTARLSGPGAHRQLQARAPTAPAPGTDAGPLTVGTLPTAAREAAFVADELRRAHLQGGVPWARMAVLARSPAAVLPTLGRACATAGVPLVASSVAEPPAAHPLVDTLLTVLRLGYQPDRLAGPVALELLTSPAGGLHPPGLRRLRRLIRAAPPPGGSSADLLAAALVGAPLPPPVPAELAVPVHRLAEMIGLARAGALEPAAATVLWRVWHRSGLQAELESAALRGGGPGRRADAALDAVVALFGQAADFAERLPMAGVRAFVEEVSGRLIGRDADRTGRPAGAVSLLSAHAAKGLEWDLVCVMGVTEGAWPAGRARESMLGVHDLLDLVEGLPAVVDRRARRVEDERRLFYVAATRARRRLIATGVQDQDTEPSRFLGELAGGAGRSCGSLAGPDGRVRRGLNVADLVADLRAVVTDPQGDPAAAGRAAAHLARLARHGVRGAHPDDWYGLAARSSTAPAVPPRTEVTISPSTVEATVACALRSVLERRGGRGAVTPAQVDGVVVHAMAAGLGAGVEAGDLTAAIDNYLARQTHLPPWQIERSRRALRRMLAAAAEWIETGRPGRTAVGAEVQIAADVPGRDEAERPIRIAGRVDWLDRAADGSLITVDFKTGAVQSTRAQTREHLQLGTYQLALDLGPDTRAGGAELVFLRSGVPKVLVQPAPDDADREGLLAAVRSAAAQWAGASVAARVNDRCDRCPVRSSCPLQPTGRQVTR